MKQHRVHQKPNVGETGDSEKATKEVNRDIEVNASRQTDQIEIRELANRQPDRKKDGQTGRYVDNQTGKNTGK